MPQFSSGHFDGKPVFFCKRFYVSAINHAFQFQVACRFLNEPIIRIAAATSKLMIEVSHGDFPAMDFGKFVEHMKQHHGIQAARSCDEHRLISGEKVSANNVFFKVPKQFAHGGI